MAGYRAGLTLALPAFDTYRCLENYARNPGSLACRESFVRLRRRAERELLYDALAHARTVAGARALLHVRTGIGMDELAERLLPYDPDEQAGASGIDLDKMSDGDVQDLYRNLCEAFGDPVDLSDSKSVSMSISYGD